LIDEIEVDIGMMKRGEIEEVSDESNKRQHHELA